MTASAAAPPVQETPSKPLARDLESVKMDHTPTKEAPKEVVVKANPNIQGGFTRKYVGDLDNIKTDADGKFSTRVSLSSSALGPRQRVSSRPCLSTLLQSPCCKKTTSDSSCFPSSTTKLVFPFLRLRVYTDLGLLPADHMLTAPSFRL